jgi:hypothetical protein
MTYTVVWRNEARQALSRLYSIGRVPPPRNAW